VLRGRRELAVDDRLHAELEAQVAQLCGQWRSTTVAKRRLALDEP
jgi:hypothetical protein